MSSRNFAFIIPQYVETRGCDCKKKKLTDGTLRFV